MNHSNTDEALYVLVDTNTGKKMGKPTLKPIAEAIQQNYAYGLNRSSLQFETVVKKKKKK